MERKILIKSEKDISEVTKREKYKFLREILLSLGLPIDFWDENEYNGAIKSILMPLLEKQNIIIIDEINADLQVFHKDQLIAKWEKPIYALKRNLEEKDRRKQIQTEMSISYWSCFEQES